MSVCRIARLPAQLLAACSSLCTLCAHQNPITVEDLRTAEGYAEYEARYVPWERLVADWVLCSPGGHISSGELGKAKAGVGSVQVGEVQLSAIPGASCPSAGCS
jgi:hypothetical protein